MDLQQLGYGYKSSRASRQDLKPIAHVAFGRDSREEIALLRQLGELNLQKEELEAQDKLKTSKYNAVLEKIEVPDRNTTERRCCIAVTCTLLDRSLTVTPDHCSTDTLPVLEKIEVQRTCTS